MALREQWFKATHEPNAIQRFISRKYLFRLLEPLGVHVTADHFYEPIPNSRLVAREYSDQPRDLAGVDWRQPECEARALDLVNRYGREFSDSATRFGFEHDNPYFRGVDALVYYALLRDRKPSQVVEIGQGSSTRIALAALDANSAESGVRPRIVSVDPFPRLTRQEVPETVDLEVVQVEVQQVDPVSLLASCDLLFVDSSHVYKFGSDVAFELTTLYPRLTPGTLLHVHDIFSPFDYPRDWMVRERRFWNEQYHLECFLMFNSSFEVHLPVHLLIESSGELTDAVRALPIGPGFDMTGGSLYLMRV